MRTAPRLTPLLTADEIQAGVRRLALEIDAAYPPGTVLLLLTVLKGGFVFLADLIRAMPRPVMLDFIVLSSYAGSDTSGRVRLVKDMDANIRGRDVVIVEDIVDTGLTLAYLRRELAAREPHSLRTVCLLDKPARRRVTLHIEHVGFTIEDRFVVGYGLDLNECYRELPYIASVED